MSFQEPDHKLQKRRSTKLTGNAKSQSAIEESAAMINSQDGRMRVLELVVTVTVESTVAVVVMGGGILDIKGVVKDGRGTELLTIVTGPRVYTTEFQPPQNDINMGVVVLVGLISVNMIFWYPVEVIVE
jgi:hypothetical protein